MRKTSVARKRNSSAAGQLPKVVGPHPEYPPGSIQARILELSAQVSDQEWSKLPRDGSHNLDHYLYGAPKR